MTKLLGRWLADTIASNSLILLPASAVWLISLALAPAAIAAEPQTAASSAAHTVLDNLGSTEGIRSNASQPLTSKEAPLYTMDRTSSGFVQVTNPSSNAFVSIIAQPAATGDLGTVQVHQDLDFDGANDYAYTIPFPVSGICANGIISCEEGTWTNCLPYAWIADSDAKVSLEFTSLNKLGGCYCINQSCGSSLVWNNIGLLMKDLGGGITGVIQRQKSSYVITEVKSDGPSITYYGQDISGPDSSAGSVSQTAYFSNPGTMSGDTESTVLSQSADPDSYYTAVTTSFANKGSATELRSCTISRSVPVNELTLADIILPMGGTGAVQSCGNNCIRVVLGRVGDNYWAGSCAIYEENYKVFITKPEFIERATLVRAIWDDYIQVWIGGSKVYNGPNANFPPETAGACELSTSWNLNPNVDVTPYFKQAGVIDTRIRVSVTGGGEGYAYVEVRVNNLCEQSADVLTDNCTVLATDPDCSLQEEEVDGVLTYHNFNPTGLAPLPSTRTITGGTSCSMNVTRDWWEKDRTYRCTSNNTFDFTDAKTRIGSVADSVNSNSLNQTDFTYTDKRKDLGSGAWTTEGHSIALPETETPPDCELVCKTRRPIEDTEAGLSGVTTDYQTSNQGYDFLYHVCSKDHVCPAGPGEEILKSCQCIDDFAEATSIIYALDAAGKDLICSDGVPK